jgi:uncharacterized OB-fold protein
MSAFAVPACAECGHAAWPPRLACACCGASEWTEVPVSSGTVTEVTDAPGGDGDAIRLGTVRLALPGSPEGPPVIARCEGCEAGDEVTVELVDGALRALPAPGGK